jgi:hypothetical protein
MARESTFGAMGTDVTWAASGIGCGVCRDAQASGVFAQGHDMTKGE